MPKYSGFSWYEPNFNILNKFDTLNCFTVGNFTYIPVSDESLLFNFKTTKENLKHSTFLQNPSDNEKSTQKINIHHPRKIKSLFVVGNGPSLATFDFKLLNNSYWLGMNAAYRYWHRIRSYPSFYACLDTVVIESHKNEIYNLIQNRNAYGIKLFFLRNCLLQSFPDLIKMPEIIFFEDYYKSSVFFNISDLLTTGSFSVLFGAMLGFKQIYLLGIDLGYVDLAEAKTVKGDILKMTKTPEYNPNYFFNDYQTKGDLFNVPDSIPNLHQKSWQIVKDSVEKLGVTIYNCNQSSNLHIFDFADFNEIITPLYN